MACRGLDLCANAAEGRTEPAATPLVSGRSARAGVAPAKAGAHIPEASGYGSPLARGRQSEVWQLRAGGAERLGEGLEIAEREVGHRPIGDAVFAPGENIVAGDLRAPARQRAAARDRAQADQVLAMAIDQRRHRRAADHVDAAADQGKALGGESDDAWHRGG